jgi:hypothetical protein
MDSEQAGQWLSLKVAAPHLGISAKTARRRARSGDLQARQISTPYGEAWEVWVPRLGTPNGQGIELGSPNGHTQDSQATPGHTQAGQGPELMEALRQLDQIHLDLLTRTEAAAMWQARAEMLAGELADARGRLAALEAPREEQELCNTVLQSSPGDQITPLPPPPRRPWYQRLLFG